MDNPRDNQTQPARCRSCGDLARFGPGDPLRETLGLCLGCFRTSNNGASILAKQELALEKAANRLLRQDGEYKHGATPQQRLSANLEKHTVLTDRLAALMAATPRDYAAIQRTESSIASLRRRRRVYAKQIDVQKQRERAKTKTKNQHHQPAGSSRRQASPSNSPDCAERGDPRRTVAPYGGMGDTMPLDEPGLWAGSRDGDQR